MRTIAFVTQKGGAGKSTLASSIAVAARRAGERVFIIDLDPLQSLVKWSQAREAADVPVEHVPPAKLGKALAALEKKGVTLVVIDAPGADSENSDAAIRAADLCIIPARPNVFDLWASELTRASIKDKKKEYAFLLNQCPPAQQNSRVEQGVATLQEMGALLTPLISSRVDYQEAARLGLGVSELHPDGVAAQEMRDLWASIKKRLKKGAAPAKPVKAEAEPEAKAKPETKAPAKAEAKATVKAAKVIVKAEPKPEAKPEAPKEAAAPAAAEKPAAEKPAAKPQAKPAVKKAA
ncbi:MULTISPECIES: ParA family protein [Methylosinus]|uniref:ATPase n=1 Tax=Methylosinus trichosporium (strain ATCC 35070 / NCIMB 11131 / UNIQEM 75 / OB3b) TaxID=595536 RepID=A0A2D2D3X7_METT3|nr:MULTISPECIES: ParA family protein [Methylosinus]ATQ69711.1 ATPase [Methylosinus trichosporium OB3b]OBS51205.1 ATPase [Methylosinus sp. 3S-1]